jgi:hypothetical protein
MGMNWRGHDLCFTQPEREGQVEDVLSAQDVHARKRKMGFPLWGGDKTWLAPQTRWTDGVPFLDLDSGAYDLTVETGLQITRTVTVSSGSQDWIVTHQLINRSSSEARWGVWDVNMVLKPGKVYLPKNADSPYPDGVKTFDEEGESIQVRDKAVGKLENLAVIHCADTKAFKFGVDAKEGWMLGILNVAGMGLVGYRKQVPAYRDGESFEIEERQTLVDLPHWPQSEKEVRALIGS